MSSEPVSAAPLRVAMLAPPWIPVPPPAYGGIEAVIALLCDGLVGRGHDVTLFAAPGSRSRATVREVLSRCFPQRIERALHEADHVARVFEAVDHARKQGHPFDIIHDHCGFTAFAMADRVRTPWCTPCTVPSPRKQASSINTTQRKPERSRSVVVRPRRHPPNCRSSR